jgi:hypothetical protein
VFNDPTVLKAIQDQLEDLNIEIYDNYLMDEWRNQGIIDMSQPIGHVIFRTRDKNHGKDVSLKCTVRFILANLMISSNIILDFILLL